MRKNNNNNDNEFLDELGEIPRARPPESRSPGVVSVRLMKNQQEYKSICTGAYGCVEQVLMYSLKDMEHHEE